MFIGLLISLFPMAYTLHQTDEICTEMFPQHTHEVHTIPDSNSAYLFFNGECHLDDGRIFTYNQLYDMYENRESLKWDY
jgi:hypothetical protein